MKDNKMIKLILTEEESDMVYDALRNHIDYVDCEDNPEDNDILQSLFDKLSKAVVA